MQSRQAEFEVSSRADVGRANTPTRLHKNKSGLEEVVGIRNWLWRHSEQGRAWQAFDRGDAQYETELDITTASFKRTISEIEDAGWSLRDRIDHRPIKRTTVSRQEDGGHEVLKTVEQKATFYFDRTETARIAPLIEQQVQERHAEEQRRQRALEDAVESRARLLDLLVGQPHRARALAASVLLGVGAILMVIFVSYTEKTTESGHLWWKTTTTSEVTFEDKLPLFVIAVIMLLAGLLIAASAIRKARLRNQNIAAAAGVKAARKKRSAARALARRDPATARDLGIGRPDLGRSYDDGGLVDANSAPVGALITWLGLTQAEAERVVKARSQLEGFETDLELSSFAGLDPKRLEAIRDYVILL